MKKEFFLGRIKMRGGIKMRKVVLYAAMSLDGYLADRNGGVDWLSGHGNIEEYDSYGNFVQEIDTVIMGRKTYDQIVNVLSVDAWVYPNLKSIVITHEKKVSQDMIHFTDENPCDVIRRIRHEKGKDIWICGGAHIIHQLMQADMIDRYHLAIIPTILGNGISLFQPLVQEMKLKLVEQKSYNGICECIYERRKV